jgi:hypothetical protein
MDDDAQAARKALTRLVEDRAVIEGTVWTPVDLVDEAFYAVADRARAALRVVPSLDSIPKNVSYRRSELRLLQTESGVVAQHHTPPAAVHADPLDEFDRDQRARITIVTVADGGRSRALIDRLVELSPDQWTVPEGSAIPGDATDITFLLSRVGSDDTAEDEPYGDILRAVLTSMALDPAAGFLIIDGAHEAPDLVAVLRLFRDARSSLVLAMPDAAYEASREAIHAELASWPGEAGFAQALLLLQLL